MLRSACRERTAASARPATIAGEVRPGMKRSTATYSDAVGVDPGDVLRRLTLAAEEAEEGLGGLAALAVCRGGPRSADRLGRVGLGLRDVLDRDDDPARGRLDGHGAVLELGRCEPLLDGRADGLRRPAHVDVRQLLDADLDEERLCAGDLGQRAGARGRGRRALPEREAELLAAGDPQLGDRRESAAA